MFCLSRFPYFSFEDSAKESKSISQNKKAYLKDTLGVGSKPIGDSVKWVIRSTPKNRGETTNKPLDPTKNLYGYHLKNVSEDMNQPLIDAVLFISTKKMYDAFKKKYGNNWDEIKTKWGGVEMKAEYAKGWEPYRAAVWNPMAFEEVEKCNEYEAEKKKPAPVFVVYTLPTCPYSIDLIKTLETIGIPHINHVVKESEKEMYREQHNWPTFPHVFLVGKDGGLHFLGGCDDFHAFLRGLVM